MHRTWVLFIFALHSSVFHHRSERFVKFDAVLHHDIKRNQNPFLLSQEKLTLMKETWKCHQEMLSFTNLSMDQKNPWSSRMDKLNQNMGERHPSLQWLLSPLGKQTLTHLPHLLFLHGHISHHHGQPLQLFGPSRHPHCQTFPHGSIRSTRTKVHGTS